MKRCGLACLLTLAAAAGCVGLPKTFPDANKSGGEAAESPVRPKRPAAVTADQVREDNAHQMSQALLEELNRDAPAAGEQ
jgi:hypothetical protein